MTIGMEPNLIYNTVLQYWMMLTDFRLIYSDKDVKEFYKSLKELARERSELLQLIQNREKGYKKLEMELG